MNTPILKPVPLYADNIIFGTQGRSAVLTLHQVGDYYVAYYMITSLATMLQAGALVKELDQYLNGNNFDRNNVAYVADYRFGSDPRDKTNRIEPNFSTNVKKILADSKDTSVIVGLGAPLYIRIMNKIALTIMPNIRSRVVLCDTPAQAYEAIAKWHSTRKVG